MMSSTKRHSSTLQADSQHPNRTKRPCYPKKSKFSEPVGASITMSLSRTESGWFAIVPAPIVSLFEPAFVNHTCAFQKSGNSFSDQYDSSHEPSPILVQLFANGPGPGAVVSINPLPPTATYGKPHQTPFNGRENDCG